MSSCGFPEGFLVFGGPQVQTAKVVGSVFSPRSPSDYRRISESRWSGRWRGNLFSLGNFSYNQGIFIVILSVFTNKALVTFFFLLGTDWKKLLETNSLHELLLCLPVFCQAYSHRRWPEVSPNHRTYCVDLFFGRLTNLDESFWTLLLFSMVYLFSYEPYRDVTFTVHRNSQYSFLPPWYVEELIGRQHWCTIYTALGQLCLTSVSILRFLIFLIHFLKIYIDGF